MPELDHITALIPAAGKPSNRILQNSNLPDAMIPINGKPVIGYILEDILARGILRAVIVLNASDAHTESYVRNKFTDKLRLAFVRTDGDRGVGYSLWLGIEAVEAQQGILVYLGDTIYKGPLSFSGNFLISSPSYEESRKWCFVENSGEMLRFINKPESYVGSGQILCGLYFFKSGDVLRQVAADVVATTTRIEISDLLDAYQKRGERFTLVAAKKWYDCGNIENYHAARVDFLRLRAFNKLSFNATTGTITKSSSQVKKIRQEIGWLTHLPDELKPLAPRLIHHKVGAKTAQYTMEYYGYQSLGDIFLYSHQNLAIWRSTLKHLFLIFDLFKKYTASVPASAFQEMYLDKTLERLQVIAKKKAWQKLFALPEIRVNSEIYENIGAFLPTLPRQVKRLYKKTDISFIHGDPCLSNILYDTQSRLIKFIDPRGCFGRIGVYGDIKYDLAKLRHSFDGKYEFIIADLFALSETAAGTFTYRVYSEKDHDELSAYFDQMLTKAGYDIRDIMLIEALLFLSMIPLHDNAPLRQKAMYITGIRLLNQLKQYENSN